MSNDEVTRMNKAQYIDELNAKERVYDQVKGSLRLAKTMVEAMDATTDIERLSNAQLESYLHLSIMWAAMAAADVQVERLMVKRS